MQILKSLHLLPHSGAERLSLREWVRLYPYSVLAVVYFVSQVFPPCSGSTRNGRGFSFRLHKIFLPGVISWWVRVDTSTRPFLRCR